MMASVREALRTFMQDGRWHSLDEIMGRFGEMVPPEIAYRRGHAQRERLVRAGRYAKTPPPWDAEHFITYGRRMALSSILTGGLSGIEHRMVDGPDRRDAEYRYDLDLEVTQQLTCIACGKRYTPVTRARSHQGQTCSRHCAAVMSRRTHLAHRSEEVAHGTTT